MSLILNIDTAIDTASISLAKEGDIIAQVSNADQKEHGSFLQPAIQSLLEETSFSIKSLDAIAVSAGPGSYTGLRVGMASAKGLCYALEKPLILVETLKILSFAAILEFKPDEINLPLIYCPMIDARRMEVFTALYDSDLKSLLNPQAMILESDSFAKDLLKNKILFFGNGAKKWEQICTNKNALFAPVFTNVLAMSKLSQQKYAEGFFAEVAYAEPLYLKEFFAGPGTA
ncbi:MAG: tRNA (adenosine(37)-N6)-threonylcarbamoyltransferase complex dimerization subunit type 1 TsaB [Ferruginibacter sp.]